MTGLLGTDFCGRSLLWAVWPFLPRPGPTDSSWEGQGGTPLPAQRASSRWGWQPGGQQGRGGGVSLPLDFTFPGKALWLLPGSGSCRSSPSPPEAGSRLLPPPGAPRSHSGCLWTLAGSPGGKENGEPRTAGKGLRVDDDSDSSVTEPPGCPWDAPAVARQQGVPGTRRSRCPWAVSMGPGEHSQAEVLDPPPRQPPWAQPQPLGSPPGTQTWVHLSPVASLGLSFSSVQWGWDLPSGCECKLSLSQTLWGFLWGWKGGKGGQLSLPSRSTGCLSTPWGQVHAGRACHLGASASEKSGGCLSQGLSRVTQEDGLLREGAGESPVQGQTSQDLQEQAGPQGHTQDVICSEKPGFRTTH